MQSINELLAAQAVKAVETLFGKTIEAGSVNFQQTSADFEGDITLVTFPYAKLSGKSIEETGHVIGEYLQQQGGLVERFNVVKGFLNLVIGQRYYMDCLQHVAANPQFGIREAAADAPLVIVEYSSPNTNKPLHLGHVRNNLLGFAVSNILKANGNRVMMVNLVNDRGIHICKSMVAWLKFGNGETPETKKTKGDHLVGKYYVKFNDVLSEELKPVLEELYAGKGLEFFTERQQVELNALLAKRPMLADKVKQEAANVDRTKIYEAFAALFADAEKEEAEKVKKAEEKGKVYKPFDKTSLSNKELMKFIEKQEKPTPAQQEQVKLLKTLVKAENALGENGSAVKEIAQNKCAITREAQEMLRKWEAGDADTIALWKTMNGWVYDGFAVTYKNLGVRFDKMYYESETYLLGKNIVEKGLAEGTLTKRDDGAVVLDLTADKLEPKILLRSDGTSVYMTQDLGTAFERYKEFPFKKHIYVVGNEQDHHFKVLKIALKRLGYDWSEGLYHLSYGMVELPNGKMKSREGTVVDADELLKEVTDSARQMAEERGLIDDMTDEEKNTLYHTVGSAALKYFMLKVDPKKTMLFNPEESVRLEGDTGPFIQYAYARTRQMKQKIGGSGAITEATYNLTLHEKDKELMKLISGFGAVVTEAADTYSPSPVAAYVYDLAKMYNSWYHDTPPVIHETDAVMKAFRLQLAETTGETIRKAMELLGIAVPEKM